MAKAKLYRNWAIMTVKPDTTGTHAVFATKNASDYRIYKEGRAPSNANLLINKITIERAPGTTSALLEKALKGAVVILKGQSGQERVLGLAKFIAPELEAYTEEDAYMLEAPVMIPAGATYDIILRWDEQNGLDSNNNEVAEIVVRVDGIEEEV
ncbi:MAG: hypothetical protein GXO39_08895 [Thermotogae bacterium]|nr:hypothetical protein [Thermotogota bacterium]